MGLGESLVLSGERFLAVYRLEGDEREAHSRARDICLEETVEFPEELVPPGPVREQIVGRIEDFHGMPGENGAGGYLATISFACETAGGELTQLLNVLWGNISIKPGIRLQSFTLPQSMLEWFKGPRFGQEGLRKLLDAPRRPILCTALKPMGLSPSELAEYAYQFALGGIDIIKDDHGLADQSFCPYEERVMRCTEAVEKANRQTGYRCVYMPHVSAGYETMLQRARFAKEAGAGALLVIPGLTGMQAARGLAEDDGIGLPIMAHPGFLGSFVTWRLQGISHYCLYGQLMRLIGADASIYPNFGGRFSFSEAECADTVAGCNCFMGHMNTIFPTPGGGMSLERVPEMLDVYGRDVIFLIGGGLHRLGPDLVENSRYFRKMVEAM